jgi:arylsulfatase A-like enzyme
VAGAGFERGFDEYREFRSESSASPGFIDETFTAAEAWLESQSEELFFLFLHTYQVHDPYDPPDRYRSMFLDVPGTKVRTKYKSSLNRYDQEIRYSDDRFGQLLDKLDVLGLAQGAIVVATSDHGEAFGEHIVAGHGMTVYDEEVLVPLVVRAPGLVPEKLRLAMQVGLVDLTPTLLDLAGVEAPAAMQGQSFAAALKGDRASWSDPPRTSRATTYKQVSVRTPRYKYIEQGRPKQRRFLFRPTDPAPFERGELSRLESDPELLAEAEAALAAHETACAAFLVEHPPIADERPRAERLPGWFVNRNEVDEMLRALGYAE